MKKVMVILVVALLSFNLVGCRSDNNAADNNSNNREDVVNNRDHSNDRDTETTEDSRDETKAESSSEKEEMKDKSSDGEWTKTTEDGRKSDEPTRDRPNKQIQAGLLTAGVWNDNENYQFFRNILNDNSWYQMQSYWNFINWERYEFYIKNEKNQPLINIEIELHDGNGYVYYQAKTDNNGYVVVYPFLNKQFIQAPSVHARVMIEDDVYEYNDISDEHEKVFTLIADAKAYSVKNLDLMLMIDTTGSMSDELEYIKAELTDVVSTVKDRNDNLSIYISGNYYRDYGDQYVVKSFPFTNNVSKVIDQMSDQSANGGGDFEEAVVEALEEAIINHKWDEKAEAKLLFLVLDAPPHHTGENISKIHELVQKANAIGIRIIPIASSGIDKHTEFLLRFLSVSTNGTYMFLTDHSGIGEDHIEPTIGFHQVKELNQLMIEVINSYLE